MARDSSGTQNQPQYSATGASADATDLSEVANFAALVGNRKVGTTSQRTTAAGADVWEGLLWADTTTGIEYRYTAGAWVAVLGTYQATGSLGALPTSAVSVATFTLPAGTYRIDGLGTYDWSTSTAPRLYSQLYNSTASALIGSTSSVGPGALAGGAAFAISSVVTLAVASVIQVRVYQTGGVGTINLTNATLLATQTTLR